MALSRSRRVFRTLEERRRRACLRSIPYAVNNTDVQSEAKKNALAKDRALFLFVLFYPVRVIVLSRKEGNEWFQGNCGRS